MRKILNILGVVLLAMQLTACMMPADGGGNPRCGIALIILACCALCAMRLVRSKN